MRRPRLTRLGFLLRLESWARPALHLVPPWGRSLLRWASGAVMTGRAETAVSGWDRPLIDGPTTFVNPDLWIAAAAAPDVVGAGTRREPEAPGLRCLIGTECLDVGGMDEVVATLARSLHDLGMTVAVAHVPEDPCQPIGRLGQSLLELLPVVTLSVDDARAWVRDWGPDMVSVHGTPTWFIDLVADLGAPVVETLHGPFDLFPTDAQRMQARSARLTAVVAVSSLVRAQFLQLCPEHPQDQVVTIPNGIRSDLGASPPRSRARHLLGLDREILFVSTARHCLQKNTHGLVSAFLDVAEQEERAHLLVAGRPDDPSYMRHVTALLDGSPAGRRVHLRDHLRSPLALLAAADSFVLDSFFEGWSLASMEAVAAGVPAVLSDVGGAREQLATPSGEVVLGRTPVGYLVPNPSGSPVDLDWALMNRLKYARQVNREPLAAAMLDLTRTAPEWLAGREDRLTASQGRFSLQTAMGRHAEVLALAAEGRCVGGVPSRASRVQGAAG